MAQPEHIKVFHRGVDAWNRWRSQHRGLQPDLSRADLRQSNLRSGNLNHANLRGANLEGANLGRAYLEAADLGGTRQRGIHLFGADLGRADLRHTDLVEAQLWHARLEEADLRSARLRGADLRHANLAGADLREADLEGAILEGASFEGSDLRGARLAGARFHGTRIRHCRFEDAVLEGAVMALTSVNDVDLSRAVGLGTVEHEEPSSIGVDTLEQTAAGLALDDTSRDEVEVFFRGAGVREAYLEVFRRRLETPFAYYSAFIRYSHADRAFARRLYDELQDRGIRCWLHEHPMLPGDDAHEGLALGRWDRLVLLTSEAACTSWWIDSEMARVAELERQNEVMVPVNLDAYLPDGRWESPAADAVRSRLAFDFNGFSPGEGLFGRGLERLATALRV